MGGGEREKPLESIDFSRVELDRSLNPFLEKDSSLGGKKSLREWVQRRSFKLLCKMKNEYSTRHEYVCVYVCVYCMYVCVYMRFSVSPVLRFSRFFFLAIIINFFFFFLPFLLLFLNCFGGEIGYSVHATR